MVRGENIASGTSSTGAGVLTLAACPAAVGAINHDVFLKAKGFVSGDAIPDTYTIIEYTDATFATPSKMEKGIGRVTLGAAIANATLTRDTVQSVEDIGGGTYNDQAPSAITIGTAANTLVFIGASAADLLANNPYFERTVASLDMAAIQGNWLLGGGPSLNAVWVLAQNGTGFDWYSRFFLGKPINVKRLYLRVTTAYAGSTGTPISALYGRIYYVGSDGRPGKLALDLGTFGTNPMNATGLISTSLASPGKFLTPGEYFLDVYATYSGATGTVTSPILGSWIWGQMLAEVAGGNARCMMIASGGSSTAQDPANQTSYTFWNAGTVGQANAGPYFFLGDT